VLSEGKVAGPASYFPSIEKKYGKPVEHWMSQLDAVRDAKHMDQVTYLKETFEMGHGHANAIVAVYRQRNGLN
jgi:hypothetical protein